MQNTNAAHPTEDELERFVLNQCQEQELENVETHILACESCVTRLEDLDVQISVTRLALQKMRAEQLAKAAARQTSAKWTWLTVPKLSIAGGLAAVALGIVVAPTLLQHDAEITQVSLSANRSNEFSVVPEGRRLHMRLNAPDLADGTVSAALADLNGVEVWTGRATIHNGEAELEMPPIKEKGTHFLRLYASAGSSSEPNLLREFAFRVK